MHRLATSIASLALALGLALTPTPVRACGGLFCSRVPVLQAGEDIAYSVDADGTLTMAVRIVYQGAAPEFAWILPVPVEPEAIDVGTNALFDALEDASEPSFQTEPVVEGECRPEPRCEAPPRSGGGCLVEESPPGACTGICSDGGGRSTIDVRSMQQVGPYESVVLTGGSAAELRAWLVEHGYDIPASSLPAIDEYVAARQLFVALRLRSESSTGEIQPIVLRLRGVQACLPIRLTRIATVADLPIAAYFLARAPAVPTNYSLIDAPADDPQLWRGRLRWADRVSAAVDNAGGQAFVMDYAGAMPALDVTLPPVDDLARSADPAAFFGALIERGYPMDAQLLAIAARFVIATVPSATSAYVQCLASGAGASCGAPGAFSSAELAAAIDAAITTPRRAAQEMIERHSTLTRLFTTMSAADMTLDPDFRIDEGVAHVSNVHVATLLTECGPSFYPSTAPQVLITPAGFRLRVREGVAVDDDEAFCARSGRRVASGGCAAGQTGAGSATPVALAIGVAIALGRRRARARRAGGHAHC